MIKKDIPRLTPRNDKREVCAKDAEERSSPGTLAGLAKCWEKEAAEISSQPHP